MGGIGKKTKNYSTECSYSWSLGVSGAIAAGEGQGGSISGGPDGVSGSTDTPFGTSPGVGIYVGAEACVIKSCPL